MDADRRPHHDRRQYRRRAGVRVRRRHGGGLVPDHAVHLADGRLQDVLRPHARRQAERPQELRLHPGRGRARRHRHGDRRDVERRARLHRHLRPRHLADERVPGTGLLRRGAGGDLRHPARRPLHRHADAHAAVRHPRVRLRLARRHAPRVPVPGQSRGVLLHGGAGVRPGRAAADPGAGAVRPRHRHERLDVPRSEVGRQLPARSRQDARPGGDRSSSRSSTATSTRTATASPTARCPAYIPRRRTSRAAPGTRSTAPTPRTPPSTSWCSIGC